MQQVAAQCGSSGGAMATSGRREQACEAERARWVTAAACVAVESLAGIMYMFGVYSPLLKSRYSLTQTELDGLATATNIANNVGIWLGSGIDRFGPRVIMASGGIIGGMVWLALWAALMYEWQLAYWQLLLIVICQGHAADAGDKSSVSVMATSFPELRGTAIGITKSLVGLSAALVAAGYTTAFSPDIVSFLRVIALAFVMLWTMCAYVVHVVPHHSHMTLALQLQLRQWQIKRFQWMNRGVVGVALVLLWAALDPAVQNVANILGLLGLAIVVVYAAFPATRGLVVAVGEVVPSAEHAELTSRDVRAPGDTKVVSLGADSSNEDDERDSLLRGNAANQVDSNVYTLDGDRAAHERGNGVVESIVGPRLVQTWYRDADFWLVTPILFINFGAGLMVINNLGQITPAIGGSVESQTANVSMYSVCSCLGRLAAGVASDWLLYAHGVPRVALFSFASIAMFVSMFFLAVGTPASLQVATIGAGLAFGCCNTQCPLIIAELFGMRHFAENFALVAMISATGSSYVFATMIFGTLYDQAVLEQVQQEPEQAVENAHMFSGNDEVTTSGAAPKECYGVACVRRAGLASAACCGLATVLSLMLFQRQQQASATESAKLDATGKK